MRGSLQVESNFRRRAWGQQVLVLHLGGNIFDGGLLDLQLGDNVFIGGLLDNLLGGSLVTSEILDILGIAFLSTGLLALGVFFNTLFTTFFDRGFLASAKSLYQLFT